MAKSECQFLPRRRLLAGHPTQCSASRRQLVRQLRPLVLDHLADIIGGFRMLSLQQIFVQPIEVVLRHDVVRDDAGLVDAASGHDKSCCIAEIISEFLARSR
jgi:hypothetical protein